MARQSRSRPAARPAAPAQSRSHTTAAAAPPAGYGGQKSPAAPAPPAPAAAAAAPPSREPGMMAQMAANMGSVAAGSVIGHGISRALFGGGSEAPAPAAAAPEPVAAQAAPVQQTSGISCEVQAKDFTHCLEKADFQSCSWYLEQLKACQAAAAPY